MQDHTPGEIPEFSSVLGGPLFQLLRQLHLEGNAGELLSLRIFAAVLLTWFPLLLFSTFATSVGVVGQVAFFRDVEVHARFLVGLPTLIGAELLVHSRIRAAVRRFFEWRIVLPEDMPRFQKAIDSAVRIRDSTYVELMLVCVVYTLGLWLWNGRAELGFGRWYAAGAGRWQLTPAGYWYVFVSLPVFQPAALVHEVIHLVSLSLAGESTRVESFSDTS